VIIVLYIIFNLLLFCYKYDITNDILFMDDIFRFASTLETNFSTMKYKKTIVLHYLIGSSYY